MRFALLTLAACLSQAGLLAQVEPAPETHEDPLLTKARLSAATLAEKLPSFTCREVTTRYRRNLNDGSWQQLGVATADVAYNGKTGEGSRTVQASSAPTRYAMPAHSAGWINEMALYLPSVFSSATDFQFNEDVAVNGKAARVFAYEVVETASHWKIKEGETIVTSPYAGRVWIDSQLGRVIRLEMIADPLPSTFKADQITTTIEYGVVNLGDGTSHLLPTGWETLSCKRESGACDRDTTELSGYRSAVADSAAAFGEMPKEFGLSAASASAAPQTGSTGTSRPAQFSFVGIVRAPRGKMMVLELDDARFVLFRAKGDARLGISPGERIRIESNAFDSHGLLADSFSPVQAVVAPAPPAKPVAAVESDEVVQRARENARTLVMQLPNFVCEQEVKRYRTDSQHKQWKFEDALSAEVLYSKKSGEEYRDVRIDGRPTTKKWLELSGDVSSGEFGSLLRGLLETKGTEYRFAKNANLNGAPTREYSFNVSRKESDWTIQSDYQYIVAAYSGLLWFDRDSDFVLRVERHAEDIPSAFPVSSVETEVNFGLVQFGPGESYLLPIHAETRACFREARQCSRKTIDFRNYKKFTGESKIIF